MAHALNLGGVSEGEMQEERTTYQQIRNWAMDSAYDACRSSIIQVQRNGPGFVTKTGLFSAFFNETYECFESELEELMWRSLEMILDRGLGPQAVRDDCSRIINNILEQCAFDDLVHAIPSDEASELRRDLKLLKFIE